MKKYLIHLGICALYFTVVQWNAQDRNLQQVVEKGKADLLEVLAQTGDQFNFDIDAEAVRGSRPAIPISYREMDFEQLLNAEGRIEATLKPESKKVVPLVTNNQVVTTLSVTAKDQGAYEISELINHQYQDELNMLPEEIRQGDFRELTIIYVPNLNTTVYTAGDRSYTTYKGSSVREGMETASLLQVLKTDAIAFQEKYGELLKQGKLVN